MDESIFLTNLLMSYLNGLEKDSYTCEISHPDERNYYVSTIGTRSQRKAFKEYIIIGKPVDKLKLPPIFA